MKIKSKANRVALDPEVLPHAQMCGHGCVHPQAQTWKYLLVCLLGVGPLMAWSFSWESLLPLLVCILGGESPTFGMESQLICSLPVYSLFLVEKNKLGVMTGETRNSRERLGDEKLSRRLDHMILRRTGNPWLLTLYATGKWYNSHGFIFFLKSYFGD